MSVDLVIFQLEQQSEAVELNNSILIEISKTAVAKWQEKLKTRYGWFKTNNCKNIIFDVSIFCFHSNINVDLTRVLTNSTWDDLSLLETSLWSSTRTLQTRSPRST